MISYVCNGAQLSNFDLRGLDALFWPWWAAGSHVLHRHTCKHVKHPALREKEGKSRRGGPMLSGPYFQTIYLFVMSCLQVVCLCPQRPERASDSWSWNYSSGEPHCEFWESRLWPAPQQQVLRTSEHSLQPPSLLWCLFVCFFKIYFV